MSNNGSVVLQWGNTTHVFKDRETYPYSLLKEVEGVVMYNSPELSSESSVVSLKFLDSNMKTVLGLSLDNGVSKLTDESKCIILVSLVEGNIWSRAYYGTKCSLDFESEKDEYFLGSVEGRVNSIRNFCKSWVTGSSNNKTVVIMVDDYDTFKNIVEEEYFENSYVFYVR